jgi:hypothetical protein
MSAVTLRRPVPLSSELATAFTRYVSAAVAAGIWSAEHWRLERRRDGAIWLAVDNPAREGDRLRSVAHRGKRRPVPSATFLAPDMASAAVMIERQTLTLEGLNS